MEFNSCNRKTLEPFKLTKKTQTMYILQSILNKAGAVWVTESLPLPLPKADRLIKSRFAHATGVRRFRLIKVQ